MPDRETRPEKGGTNNAATPRSDDRAAVGHLGD